MPNYVKHLGYIKSYSSSSPRPVKSSSILIRHNCQKICSWSRRPWTILEIWKKATFLYVLNNPSIYKFFKDFTNHRKRAKMTVVFSSRPFLNILKYRNHWWDFPTIWKTRLSDTLKSSVKMYESSGSQFFRTTTGIQSGPEAFDESRFVTTFLTILGVMEILWSFRLVLDGEIGKEISKSSRLEFLEKFLANNSELPDTEDNTSHLLNKRIIADLTLLRTLFAIR